MIFNYINIMYSNIYQYYIHIRFYCIIVNIQKRDVQENLS